MNEFALIGDIAQALGNSATAPWVHVGIGDDAAVLQPRAGFDAVASIDTLVACPAIITDRLRGAAGSAPASSVLVGLRARSGWCAWA